MVASHITFSLQKDRRNLWSGYPSEPLVAEAAARQMDAFQRLGSVTDPDTNVMANLPKSEFSSGLLDSEVRLSFVSLFGRLIDAQFEKSMPRNLALVTSAQQRLRVDYLHKEAFL
jgi:hypothetical protein